MDSNIVCKLCHQPNHSLNYTCNCQKPGWANAYRTLYHKITPDEISELASDSFREYSFFNPRGMLQHKTLPVNSIAKNDYPTVGLTPLYELENLSQYYGAEIYLKDEGHNPSGCFKDRETVMCLQNSINKNITKATIFSSGNAAASAAYFTKRAGHKLITFVSGDTYPEKIDFIRRHGADVVVIGDQQTGFEDGYEIYSNLNAKNVFADQHYDNWSVNNPYRTEGDKTIALEIIKQFSTDKKGTHVPEYVIVPTANGSCLAGVWKGFKELHQAEVILRLPRMISVGIKNANPVAKAVAAEATEHPLSCDLSKTDEQDLEVGSVIVASEGYDSMEAAKAVLDSGGRAIELRRSDIQRALVEFLALEENLAIDNNILPEPAGLTSLAAIRKLKNKNSFSFSDCLVSIATGDGLKAEEMLCSLLSERPVLLQKVKHILNSKRRRENRLIAAKGKKIKAEANTDSVIQSFSQLQQQYVNV